MGTRISNKPTYYLDRFFRRNRIGSDLLLLNLFPNCKEVSESFGCYDAIWRHGISRNDENVIVFVVGDGRVPRTGGLLAFKSKWTIISIDPMMKEWNHPEVKRLTTIKGKIEELDLSDKLEYFSTFKTQVILHVHSHAYLTHSVSKLFKEGAKDKVRMVVSLPCCIRDNLTSDCISYIDKYILSEKNRINIYPISNLKIVIEA